MHKIFVSQYHDNHSTDIASYVLSAKKTKASITLDNDNVFKFYTKFMVNVQKYTNLFSF